MTDPTPPGQLDDLQSNPYQVSTKRADEILPSPTTTPRKTPLSTLLGEATGITAS